MSTVTLLCGDVIEVLKTLPDKSIHSCICSPPFYGLRDYGTGTWEGGNPECKHTMSNQVEDRKAKGAITSAVHPGAPKVCRDCGAKLIDMQIGLEETPELYVARLVEVFREVRRVLRDDGTLWLNLGDSFWGGKGKSGYELPHEAAARHARGETMQKAHNVPGEREMRPTDGKHVFYKPKDLMLLPARVALALLADGWFLRQDIIWAKSNPMPESVSDRPTTSHEHIFLLAKQRHYYYDGEAIKEPATMKPQNRNTNGRGSKDAGYQVHRKAPGATNPGSRQKRSVWVVPTKSYKGAHFAVWPEALVEPMLLASTSAKGCCPACGAPWKRITKRIDKGYDGSRYGEHAVAATGGAISGGTAKSTLGSSNGKLTGENETVGWRPSCKCEGDLEPVPCTVIDIFNGAGTTGVVAIKHGRNYIGIDLKPEYIELSRKRLNQVQPLLLLEEK